MAKLLLLKLFEDILWFGPCKKLVLTLPYQVYQVAVSVTDISIQNGLLLLLCHISTGSFFKIILLATALIEEYWWLKLAKYKYGLLKLSTQV